MTDHVEQRISLITLGVADVSASRKFYERLGWTASSASNDQIAFFQAGCIGIALYGREALAQDAKFTPGTTAFKDMAIAYNVHRREEVDEALAEVRRAGATILKPPQDTSSGGYSAYFSDPDGHVWEVAFNPAFPLQADGAFRLPD